ncbi:Imm21 family immunity protein [Cupriavidus numazuensis]|uniref:Uncharacterized protein n=1 Tax=Cupriavidus numazuensis TaxID=221992 RepID=A0ABM8TS61_9BURK|nr:Imm21 family immunity protein [Cupriavidus numazuensis]CAG2159132.1 hypothetical protein LMG26411_06464 [Cupriavidus numazuensis]
MSKYRFSRWISSTGGPLVVMEKGKARQWTGIDGSPSDYDLSCQISDYAGKILVHGTETLILGDEPLRTAVATGNGIQLLVRWKWADSDSDVYAEVERIDPKSVKINEKLIIDWRSDTLVMFDGADFFSQTDSVQFSVRPGENVISTFVVQPTARTAILVHAICAKQ